MSNTVSIAGLRPQLWEKKLFEDTIANLFFVKNGFMGEDENNVIQIKTGLMKSAGDQINLPLTTKLSGGGTTGDSELEGNEEAVASYSEAVVIDQIRHAVRLTGKLDEQKNAYDMRLDAKNKLQIWMKEFIERQLILKICGVNNLLLTDINGVVVGAKSLWSNTPDEVSDTDTNNGYGERYLCADYTSGATSLAATDLITPALISRCKAKAQNANPKIAPLVIDGKESYIMLLHPNQAYDLKQNAVWSQAMREAEIRGKNNPIFNGSLGVWDNVILFEHEYMPFLDISVAGHNYGDDNSGTDYAAVDCYRSVLLGRQAAVFAKCKNPAGWVEKTFDYENKTGFAVSMIGGIQKVQFNSQDYGVVTLDTAATAI